MKLTKFKVLMHCDEYVDANLLASGIYTVATPQLYDINMTIENIEDATKEVSEKFSLNIYTEQYVVNLKQCKLIEIALHET